MVISRISDPGVSGLSKKKPLRGRYMAANWDKVTAEPGITIVEILIPDIGIMVVDIRTPPDEPSTPVAATVFMVRAAFNSATVCVTGEGLNTPSSPLFVAAADR